jgi:hypothetical protein
MSPPPLPVRTHAQIEDFGPLGTPQEDFGPHDFDFGTRRKKKNRTRPQSTIRGIRSCICNIILTSFMVKGLKRGPRFVYPLRNAFC